MKCVRSLQDIGYDKNSVVTVGTFDGVHCAHQHILQEVVSRAKQRNGRSVVVTFEPHPREIIQPNRPIALLTTEEERRQFIAAFQVDVLFTIEFHKEFSQKTFRVFFEEYIVRGIGVSEVVEGYNHHWGHNRQGDVSSLLLFGKEFDFTVKTVEPVMVDGVAVNSSLIRDVLAQGDAEHARTLLGRPYALSGLVIHGDRRGRLLGFPTANVVPGSTKKLVPKNGVYCVTAEVNGTMMNGMASIGVRPTFFQHGVRLLEVNVFDRDMDMYDTVMNVHFLKRLRDEVKFDSAEELIRHMRLDEAQCREYLQTMSLK